MPNLYKRGDKWWARFTVAGHEYRRSLRTTVRAEAERRLKAVKKEVEDEALFGIAPPLSWSAAVLAWNQDATADLSPKTVKRYLTSLKQCHVQLNVDNLRKIDVPLLRGLVKARRLQGATTATIRRDLTAISSILDYAIGEEWIQENPTLTVRHKRLRERRHPITLPTDEDIAAMVGAAPQRFADAIEFARETGMREEEIFGLTHRQIGGSEITIRGKRARLRVVPLSRKARAIIDRQAQFIGSPYVFHQGNGRRWASPASRFGDIRRRKIKAAQKAAQDFVGFRFHDLRHLYAVEYLRAGKGSLYDLQQLMGHESVKTTEIYLEHLTPEQRKAAIHGTKDGTAAAVRA